MSHLTGTHIVFLPGICISWPEGCLGKDVMLKFMTGHSTRMPITPREALKQWLKELGANYLASSLACWQDPSEALAPCCFPGFSHRTDLQSPLEKHPLLAAFPPLPHFSTPLSTFHVNYWHVNICLFWGDSTLRWCGIISDGTGSSIREEGR